MAEDTHTSEDSTGRGRLVKNVLTSWGGHLIFVVAGFVLPRLIDQKLGQNALGIWDFGWSFVSYFNLAQVGIGSSVNRYVARHRAERDTAALNGAMSSVMCAQVVAAVIAGILTVVAAESLPILFQDRLGEFIDVAWWVVLLLGLGLTVEILCDSFAGVMTGCHRWDLHYTINAGFYGLTAIASAITLLQGGGLRALALVSLVGTVLTEGTRTIVAYRVCPELRVRWQYVNWAQFSELFVFGGKVVLGAISFLLIYQTTSLLIIQYLGVGALAIYARALAPVRHCGAFVEKFASVLTTTASSMHAKGQEKDLQTFLLQSVRHSMAMALPPILLLAILGNSVLQLWMGADYAHGEVLAVLALGHLMSMAQAPVWTILRGLDKHGWAATIRVIGAGVVVVLSWVVLRHFQAGLFGTALAVTVPLSVLDGICLPWYATRQLKISFGHYIWFAWLTPLLWVMPFAACLFGARFLFPTEPVVALAAGMSSGGLVLAVVYWRWALAPTIREQIRGKLLGLQRRAGVLVEAPRS